MNTLFMDVQARHDGFGDLGSFNIVIVTHGLSLRLFLMRWFHLTVQGFEQLWNPINAGYVIMEPTNAAADRSSGSSSPCTCRCRCKGSRLS